TNLDRPVFALVNLPETVKGALFARYSRYQGTLRRLFLDEFAGDLPEVDAAWEGDEGERAAQLYERIFLGYGDDSVAQLGGAHIACEWVSNILTKILQRPRLAAYLEQSTRYIAYDAAIPDPPGGYRYYRDDELGPEYAAAMDSLFDTYAAALPAVSAWAEGRFPRGGDEPEAAHRRAIRRWAANLGLDRDEPAEDAARGPSVQLLHVDGTQEDMLSALLFEAAGVSEEETRATIARMSGAQLEQLWTDLAGDRRNRRYRPGRGLETLRYRFEIVSDYGAFRDLQRHRMLTCQWQALTPDLGAGVPGEVDEAGQGDAYRGAL